MAASSRPATPLTSEPPTRQTTVCTPAPGLKGATRRYVIQCREVWRRGRWSRTGGVAACRELVGAGLGAGEEAEACPFGQLGEHVVGFDAEFVCELAASPGSARVVFHEFGDDVSSGRGRVRVARLAVAGSPGLVDAGGVQGDLDVGDGGWQVGASVVAVEVAGGGVLQSAAAPAASARWQ